MKSAFRFFGIVTLTVIIGFGILACSNGSTGNGSDDKGVEIPGGTVTSSSIKVDGATVYIWDDGLKPLDNSYDSDYLDSDAFGPGSVCKIENGKLTINLGEPIDELEWVKVDFDTVSDENVKYYFTYVFIDENNYWLQLLDENSCVYFIYVDGDVELTSTTAWFSGHFECDKLPLKKGWNVVIKDDSSGTGTIGTPTGFKWIVN